MSECEIDRWSASQTLSWIICQKPLRLEAHEWAADMGPNIEDAQARLSEAIARGAVRPWGRKDAHGLVERIPSDPFRIVGCAVVVGPHGEIKSSKPQKPYRGPEWHSIEFDPREIKQAFPEPPPVTALAWMQEQAERTAGTGYFEKREIMILECMKETGCTKRQAEAAHGALPDNLKRKRGKPPKRVG